MRFLARRLVFYLLAFFIAITINFALPRLMPGSPLDGLILLLFDVLDLLHEAGKGSEFGPLVVGNGHRNTDVD